MNLRSVKPVFGLVLLLETVAVASSGGVHAQALPDAQHQDAVAEFEQVRTPAGPEDFQGDWTHIASIGYDLADRMRFTRSAIASRVASNSNTKHIIMYRQSSCNRGTDVFDEEFSNNDKGYLDCIYRAGMVEWKIFSYSIDGKCRAEPSFSGLVAVEVCHMASFRQ